VFMAWDDDVKSEHEIRSCGDRKIMFRGKARGFGSNNGTNRTKQIRFACEQNIRKLENKIVLLLYFIRKVCVCKK